MSLAASDDSMDGGIGGGGSGEAKIRRKRGVYPQKTARSQTFAVNTRKLRDQIRASKISDLEGERIASAQVDLIVHSMGGCLARKLAVSPDYLRADNFGEGDFHKLLTLNTPHLGSPLATAITSLKSDLSVSSVLVLNLVAHTMHTSLEQIMGGAVDDLRPDSDEIAAFQELGVPARAHAGVGGSDLGSALAGAAGVDPFAAVYVTMALLTEEPSLLDFLSHEHDAIVLAESQIGGLSLNHYDESHDLDGLHNKATGIAATGNIALQWAQTPGDDINYFGTFPAHQAVASGGQQRLDMTSEYGGTRMSLDVSPGLGQPGQDIQVDVYPDAGVELTDVIVAYPGGALALVAPDLSGTVTIPIERYGSMELHAIGKTVDGDIVDA